MHYSPLISTISKQLTISVVTKWGSHNICGMVFLHPIFQKVLILLDASAEMNLLFCAKYNNQKEVIYEKAQELLNAISDKEGLSIPENVTISIGIAFTDPYETSYTTLFQKADTAQ